VTAAAVAGWVVALACAGGLVAARRRLARVADAEHELRGSLTAFGLGVERFARTAAGRRLAFALEAELARARAALGALSRGATGVQGRAPLERLVRSAASAWAPSARGGVDVDWPAGLPAVAAPSGPVAQVLGNVVSNAVEHGDGTVRLRGVAIDGGVRVDVSNRAGAQSPATRAGRGRGVRIARRAARAAGGRLTLGEASGTVTAVLELPVER
jgi:signal transduction histidine kinase